MAASSSDAPLPAAPQRKRRTGTPAFSAAFLEAFETHTKRLKQAHEVKKEATSLKNVAIDKDVVQAIDVWDTLGKRQPSDKFNGCVNLRTLRTLLGMIDERGFERSEHQRQFHSAFERCVSRVVYKGEWAKDRTSIMAHNDWARCSSEVMIRCEAVPGAELPTPFVVLFFHLPPFGLRRSLLSRCAFQYSSPIR